MYRRVRMDAAGVEPRKLYTLAVWGEEFMGRGVCARRACSYFVLATGFHDVWFQSLGTAV